MSDNKSPEPLQLEHKSQKLIEYEQRLRAELCAELEVDQDGVQNPPIDPEQEVYARLNNCYMGYRKSVQKSQDRYDDLSQRRIFNTHCNLLVGIANTICLSQSGKEFVIDEHNTDVLRFMLHYFNRSKRAEEIFPDRNYKLHNNLLIMGKVGTGKTMLMQIFAEYLRVTKNPNAFYNVSVTQMTNYFSMHNNIDLYTFNEAASKGFDGQPMNICLNDIGVDNRPFYGIDTRTIVGDFLHARNEIWTQTAVRQRRFAHLTTNLTENELAAEFKDAYGRLHDRFKTYNILTLGGPSRR